MRRLLLLALLTGCTRATADGEFEDLGLKQANSEPPPGVLIPVAKTDLDAVTERGRLLARAERALRLAYEQGLSRVGDEADVTLPLVDVDPGGKSAQVLFVRWNGPAAEDLAVDDAQRWVLVSLLLEPDRVLDVELLHGAVEEGSHVSRRIRTLLAAARRLSEQAPGAMFHLLDLYERFEASDAKSKTVGRVYALSADGDGPDLVVVVDQVSQKKKKKKAEPKVLESFVVHPAGKAIASPIVTADDMPTASTVARALLQGPGAGEVVVMTSDDASWTISAVDGRITAPETP